MRRKVVDFVAGVVVGGILFSGGAAYAASITAQYNPRTVDLDGKGVQMEAYIIDGNNYVKLRDIGQAVGFNVYWADSMVHIDSSSPYTGEAPTRPEPTPPASKSDYSVEATPAIFTGDLTREFYDAVRDTMVNKDAITAEDREPVPIAGTVERYGPADSALIAISRYPVYELDDRAGRYVCNVRYPEAYQAPATYTQGFVDGLSGLSQREKVRQIAWYVCDRLTYSLAYPSPSKVLTGDAEVPGCCMAYAYSFQFLCGRAGIPCILVHSETHQWNMVYVDGQWWDVDVSAIDDPDPQIIERSMMLRSPSERIGSIYTDSEPDITRFAQELLVPGSTK